MSKIFTLGIFLFVIIQVYGQKREKFSAKEVREDFKFLYETLQASHIDLYVNTPKATFDYAFGKINKRITDSLTSIQINRLFQPFVALSKLGHCATEYPTGS